MLSWVLDTAGSEPRMLEDSTNAYIYGPGRAPIEQISLSGSTPSYLISDPSGVAEQLSSAGTPTGHMSYGPYGTRCTATGCSLSTPFGYQGAWTDPATGFVYLINRFYDPATKQFISVDPLQALTNQPYAYAGLNPVNFSDPLGLSSFWGSLGSAAIGVVSAISSGVVQVAMDVGHFVRCHWRGIVTGIGIAAGVLAAVTGFGDLAELGILGYEEGSTLLATTTDAATIVSSASDVPACYAGNHLACASAAVGALSAGIGFAATTIEQQNAVAQLQHLPVSDLKELLPQLLAAKSFSLGAFSLFSDIGGALSGGGQG